MPNCLQQEDVVVWEPEGARFRYLTQGFGPEPFLPEARFHVFKADLQFIRMSLKVAVNLLILSWFRISSAGMTGVHQHSQLTQHWESNPGPHTCQASTLAAEPRSSISEHTEQWQETPPAVA